MSLLPNDAAVVDAHPDEAAPRRLGAAFWVCVGWLVLIVSLAILAPWLPLKNPNSSFTDRDLGRPPYSPSGTFWFGSDKDARDVFSRTIFGARVSLVVGFVAIACGMVIGGTLGLLAGYFRGWFDRIISFAFIVLLSFPALVLAILITTLLNRSLFTISATLGFLAIAPVGRLARATTIQYADREFVLAARTLGAKHPRIIIRELLPNVVIPMGALALLGMAVAIVAEGGLAFLGLSVQKEETWGKLILLGSGSRDLEKAPWISMAPIFVLFLTVLALNYAGDRLRAYFDVKEISL
ncbi:MAG: ABC transporter permease [Ilumatobacteraceae bacterium]